MKKKRNLIISLLLIAAMVVGVGYAELTRVLLVTSEANIRAGEGFDVYFTDGVVSSSEAKITSGQNAGQKMDDADVATVSHTATTAHYSILGLSQKDDFVTITYTISNQSSDLTAYLNAVSMTSGEVSVDDGATYESSAVATYFTKTVTIKTNTQEVTLTNGLDLVANPVSIGAGETATLTITVQLNKTLGAGSDPVHVMLRSGSVSLQFKDVAPTTP